MLVSLLASAVLAFSPVDEPLPTIDVKLHAWGVEFIGSDGVDSDVEWFIEDPIEFEFTMLADPMTIDDCLATAQQACIHGIKRFYYRAGDPAICDFECFPGTGTGG